MQGGLLVYVTTHVKVKPANYGPGQAYRVPWRRISEQSANEGVKIVSLMQ